MATHPTNTTKRIFRNPIRCVAVRLSIECEDFLWRRTLQLQLLQTRYFHSSTRRTAMRCSGRLRMLEAVNK